MGKRNNSIIISAVLVAFLVGTITANPVVEAAGGWKAAFDDLINGNTVVDLNSASTIGGSPISTGAHTTDASELTLGTLPAARIGSNSITAAELAANSVGGSEIIGTSKLIFARCIISVPTLAANAFPTSIPTCTISGVSDTDEVVGSMSGFSSCLNADNITTGTNTIFFLLRNTCSFTISQGTAAFSLIIFDA